MAVAIISFGLLGVLAVTRRSLHLQPIAKNRIVAINLAQEGIEVIRNMRDTNWLKGNDWRLGIGEGLELGGKKVGCVNYDSSSLITPCSGRGLSINDNGIFIHSSEPNTPFSRTITIDYQLDQEGIGYLSVSSAVEWQVREKQNLIEAKEHLYDWWE